MRALALEHPHPLRDFAVGLFVGATLFALMIA